MDGTRRARLIAVSATVAFGLTLFAAAVVATAPPGDDTPSGTGTVARTPTTILTASPVTATTVVTPRTTPPPTYPGVGTGAERPPSPSPAMTVEHS